MFSSLWPGHEGEEKELAVGIDKLRLFVGKEGKPAQTQEWEGEKEEENTFPMRRGGRSILTSGGKKRRLRETTSNSILANIISFKK